MNETISLLPFIESGEDGFSLNIPVLDHDRAAPHSNASSFQIKDSTQNFSILVKAGLKVGSSNPFTSLFLLVQRDHYPISSHGLMPLTNPAIDRIWYETILSYAQEKNVFVVPKQLAGKDKAIPFGPLFFCRKMKKFFHPPCPECGAALELCTDDDLLKRAALFPYSTSLRRYLFCPDCHRSNDTSSFYQFERSAGDPAFTRDRFDLVRDFNRLRSTPSKSFPCLDCPGHAECYITGEKAGSYIDFFSFYPFHMLFFDAEPISAVEFIPFLSGASLEQTQAPLATVSRAAWKNILASGKAAHFFFEKDDRFFLEVFFLKLSFIESLVRSLYQRLQKNIYSLVDLSVQSIWIRPQSQGGSLPFFWDFNLRVIDLISNGQPNHFESIRIKNQSTYFMASLWFYIFFVNKNQEPEQVYETIGTLAKQGPASSLWSDYNDLTTAFPSVTMENIFWDPGARRVPQKYQAGWLKMMLTGLDLFDAPKEQDQKQGLKQLLRKIKGLKQEAHEQLFSTVPQTVSKDQQPDTRSTEAKTLPPAEPVTSQPEKKAISRILKKIKADWAAQKDPGLDPDDDVLETVVLSSREAVPKPDMDQGIEKTIVMSVPRQEPDNDNGFKDMEETVILSPGSRPAVQPPDPYAFDENDDLDKTVVITPKK